MQGDRQTLNKQWQCIQRDDAVMDAHQRVLGQVGSSLQQEEGSGASLSAHSI